MATTPITAFGQIFRPLTNITPFTFTGYTFLEMYMELRDYLVDTLSGELNEKLKFIYDETERLVIELSKNIDASKTEWQKLFDMFMDNVIEELEGLNDQAVANLVNKTNSQIRIALDALYASKYETDRHALTSSHATPDSESHYRQWDTPLNPAATGRGGLAIGTNAAAQVPLGAIDNKKFASFIAVGRDAGAKATDLTMAVLLGDNVMSKGSGGFANIGIGAFALSHCNGGHRNVAIGSLAGHFITTGYQNTLIGRDSGHALTDGNGNVGIGYRTTAGGQQNIGLSGEIENMIESSAFNNVGVGNSALTMVTGYNNVGIGFNAGSGFSDSYENVFIGAHAGSKFGSHLSENGYVLDRSTKTGTYAQVDNNITVLVPNHGVTMGRKANITFSTGVGTGEAQWILPSSVPDANTVVFRSPKSLSAYGTAVINRVEKRESGTNGRGITVIGANALRDAVDVGTNVVVIGDHAGITSEGENNTFIGSRSGGNFRTGSGNTALGYNTGRGSEGVPMTSFNNTTTLGMGASATASNQVQLGNPDTSVFAYGSVQNRSDVRDKSDVRDTVHGLSFIEKLRPVDFKYDYREGGQKGERFHHGLIAQELESVIKESGVDFGGYQDHSVSGGGDVKSIGYSELIAPLIKAVQELSARVKELEG